MKQLRMGEGDDELSVKEREMVVELPDGQLPNIPDDVAIRPLLRTEDLKLIRKGFEYWIGSGRALSSEVKCRKLLQRVLRKVKVRAIS